MTLRPPLPPARDRGGNNAATLTALLLLVGCAAGLFFLIMVVAPFALGVVVIGLVFVPMTVMHYLVWGRLMEQHHRRAEEEDQQADGP